MHACMHNSDGLYFVFCFCFCPILGGRSIEEGDNFVLFCLILGPEEGMDVNVVG